MEEAVDTSAVRLALLEKKLARADISIKLLGIAVLALAGLAFMRTRSATVDSLEVHRLVMRDDHGVKRVEIAQDDTAWRRAMSAGVRIFDAKGDERGGMSTFADGSVTLSLDAPKGVGASMSDRGGLVVDADGSAKLQLLANDTGAVVSLATDGNKGGLELYRFDKTANAAYIRRVTYAGEEQEKFDLPANQ
ncbi:hypothetical protein KPL74_03385 [Bacillus sp. NP157]|nr:hypothetical protein KPL74_03385 [Bacillus sp. NP157]